MDKDLVLLIMGVMLMIIFAGVGLKYLFYDELEREQLRDDARETKCTRLCGETDAAYFSWDRNLRTRALKCYCEQGERITDFYTTDVEI